MSPSCHTQNSIPHDYPGSSVCKERLENQEKPTIITLDNPRDFRLAREHVLKTIHRAIEENPGKRVVVLMGEEHATLFHLIFQEAVRRGLEQDQKAFIWAQELPHNTVDVILNRVFPENTPLLTQKDYRILTSLLHTYQGSCYAPLTSRLLAQQQVERGLPTIRCDLARKEEDLYKKQGLYSYLDTNDPWTRDVVALYGPSHIDKEISATSPKGMYFRNIGIVEKILEKTENQELVLLSTGAFHVFGLPCEFPYEESLHARLLQKGCVPVSFCFEDSHIKRGGLPIPEGARYHTTIQNADQRSFPHFLEDPSGKELKRAQEIFFMNDMPWPQGIKTPDDIKSLGEKNISNFLNLCENAAIKIPKANPS